MPTLTPTPHQLNFAELSNAAFVPNGVERTRSRRSRSSYLPDPLQTLSSTQRAKPPEPPPAAVGSGYERINPEWMDRWAPSPASEDAIKFRHSFWDAARERTRRAMVDAGFPISRRYAFQECGGSGLV